MEVSMRALLELRREAASGTLPQDQLRRVARTAVFTIDKGNRCDTYHARFISKDLRSSQIHRENHILPNLCCFLKPNVPFHATFCLLWTR
jgi:hypothetical protein